MKMSAYSCHHAINIQFQNSSDSKVIYTVNTLNTFVFTFEVALYIIQNRGMLDNQIKLSKISFLTLFSKYDVWLLYHSFCLFVSVIYIYIYIYNILWSS